jgi:hypothetical protein
MNIKKTATFNVAVFFHYQLSTMNSWLHQRAKPSGQLISSFAFLLQNMLADAHRLGRLSELLFQHEHDHIRGIAR